MKFLKILILLSTLSFTYGSDHEGSHKSNKTKQIKHLIQHTIASLKPKSAIKLATSFNISNDSPEFKKLYNQIAKTHNLLPIIKEQKVQCEEIKLKETSDSTITLKKVEEIKRDNHSEIKRDNHSEIKSDNHSEIKSDNHDEKK